MELLILVISRIVTELLIVDAAICAVMTCMAAVSAFYVESERHLIHGAAWALGMVFFLYLFGIVARING